MVLKKKQSRKSGLKFDNPKISGYYSIILFLIFIILDRITKIWALSIDKPINLGILELVYATNTGAGFSILQNQNTMLSWLAVIVLGIIIYYKNSFPKIGFIMILAGIIGNLIDRISYGYVIDFINFRFWPVFNIADSLIFIGVLITIIVLWKKDKKKDKEIKKKKNNDTKKTC